MLTLTPSASLTRPADTTAYAVGDLLANNTAAGSVVPLSFTIGLGLKLSILKARLRKTGTTTTAAAYRVHLFAVLPTVANGDNGAFLPNQAAGWLGSLDVASMLAFSDGAAGNGVPTEGNAISVDLGAVSTIYALIEVRGAYTPANAEVFTLALEAIQD